MKMMKVLGLVGVALAASCLLSQADIVTLQNGVTNVFSGGVNYAGVEDNTLVAGTVANRNYGERSTGWIGVDGSDRDSRVLIRYDLTSMSNQNIVITSAVLRVRTSTSTAATVDVYRVSVANADWIEGSKNGGVEAASCWNDKKYASIQEWAGSIGLGTSSTDYFATALSSEVNGAGYEDFAFNDVSFMADWINGTDNGGVILRSDQLEGGLTGLTIYTSENVTTHSPQLVLGYGFLPQGTLVIIQ